MASAIQMDEVRQDEMAIRHLDRRQSLKAPVREIVSVCQRVQEVLQ